MVLCKGLVDMDFGGNCFEAMDVGTDFLEADTWASTIDLTDAAFLELLDVD